MKKAAALLLSALLLLTVTGCLEKEYYFETSSVTGGDTQFEDSVDIRNYSMLKSALTNLIAHHAEHGQVRFVDYPGSPTEALSTAGVEIRSNTPLGAYAVDSLSFDVSYVVSYYVADLTISYLRSVDEVQSIVYALSQEDFCSAIRAAIDEYAPRLTIRLYSAAVNEKFIEDLVRQDYFDDPVRIPTEPQVTVKAYPAEGANRLYDISLSYDAAAAASQEMTRAMRELLEEETPSIRGKTPARTALAAAGWLSGLKPEGANPAAAEGTAYGALLSGSKDPKGLALAYKAVCNVLGIECVVVEGSRGSLGTETHFWNIIGIEGEHYHVDVSAFERGPSLSFLLGDADLWGEYIWTAADYPACTGDLSFASVVGLYEAPAAAEQPEEAPTEEKAENENAEKVCKLSIPK